MERLEAKLAELERSSSQYVPTAPSSRSADRCARRPSHSDEDELDAPVERAGGSIADRMRLLQNAGLSVSTTKRFSREAQGGALLPISQPDASSSRLHRASAQNPPSSSPISPSPLLASLAASSSLPSPHTLVPTSSFGPPSPSSSTSSSPRINHMALTEFTTAFPSIDELDEMDSLRLPSVPTGGSTGSSSGRHAFMDRRIDGSPLVFPKPFPVLPMDPGPRPSSTPIPPTIDTFVSRPGSPMRPPHSPVVPRKPSGLGLNMPGSPSAPPAVEPPADKPDLPQTSLFPRRLLELRDKENFRLLLIDVRTREEFEREHIRAHAVVCVEPSVLLRSK